MRWTVMDLSGLDLTALASLAGLLPAIDSELAVAGLVFVGTALLIALCVPGVLVPVAVSSGALLGDWAVVPVALGALFGSQLLFLAVRHGTAGHVRGRLGRRLERFEERFSRYGLWYVVGLRLIGAPHFVVTAGSAMLPVSATAFAAATLGGFGPVIAIATAAGSAI